MRDDLLPSDKNSGAYNQDLNAAVARTMENLARGEKPDVLDAYLTSVLLVMEDDEEPDAEQIAPVASNIMSGDVQGDLVRYMAWVFSGLASGRTPDDVLHQFGQPSRMGARNAGIVAEIQHLLKENGNKLDAAEKAVAERMGMTKDAVEQVWRRNA